MYLLDVTVNIGSRITQAPFFTITSIGTVITNILTAALIMASLAFLLYFAISTFRWLTAGGDKGLLEDARQRMTNSFIGLVLVAASWAVYLIVIYVLGLPISTNPYSP